MATGIEEKYSDLISMNILWFGSSSTLYSTDFFYFFFTFLVSGCCILAASLGTRMKSCQGNKSWRPVCVMCRIMTDVSDWHKCDMIRWHGTLLVTHGLLCSASCHSKGFCSSLFFVRKWFCVQARCLDHNHKLCCHLQVQIIMILSKIWENWGRSDAMVFLEIDWLVSSSTSTDCNQQIFSPFSTKPCFSVSKFHSLGRLKLQINTSAESPTTFAVPFLSLWQLRKRL